MSPKARPLAAPAPRAAVLDADRLYIGDNGRVHCGALRCAGMSAHFTGIALDGVPVEPVTREIAKRWSEHPDGLGPITCESCGRGVS